MSLQDGVICVVDMNGDCRPSVTNDAENVVLEVGKLFDVNAYPLIYRDSAGVWDEIVVKDGKFAGFKSLDQRDLPAAIAKVRRGGEARMTAPEALARYQTDEKFKRHVNAIAYMRNAYSLAEIQAMVALAEGLHRAAGEATALVDGKGERLQ